MLDARAGVTAAVGLRCLFIGVQGQAHGRVANGVRENLKTAAVQLRHRLLILVSLPKHLSAYAAVVSVGRQYRRRVRLDDAVEHRLDSSGREPLVVEPATGFFNSFDRLRLEGWRIQEVGDVHAHGERSAAPKLTV